MKQINLGLSHLFITKKIFWEKEWIFSLFPCFTTMLFNISVKFNHENADLCMKPFLQFVLPIDVEFLVSVFFIWLTGELKFWKHIF